MDRRADLRLRIRTLRVTWRAVAQQPLAADNRAEASSRALQILAEIRRADHDGSRVGELNQLELEMLTQADEPSQSRSDSTLTRASRSPQ